MSKILFVRRKFCTPDEHGLSDSDPTVLSLRTWETFGDDHLEDRLCLLGTTSIYISIVGFIWWWPKKKGKEIRLHFQLCASQRQVLVNGEYRCGFTIRVHSCGIGGEAVAVLVDAFTYQVSSVSPTCYQLIRSTYVLEIILLRHGGKLFWEIRPPECVSLFISFTDISLCCISRMHQHQYYVLALKKDSGSRCCCVVQTDSINEKFL